MGDTNRNLVDPKAATPDFGFAFNNRNFSDRILHIEIVAGDAEAANSTGESILSDDGSNVPIVKTLHISPPILAEKSPFFYKLFSNGMMESKQGYITLRISNSDEAAFMELLSYMYCNTLTSKTTPALLDVLRVADKFEVASSKHLSDASKEFLVDRYKDLSKCQDVVIDFPLTGIEAILSSDSLHVTSEDEVYDFALKWTRAHYQEPKEQKEIFSTHLGPYIRFSYMTCKKLRKLITCDDFDHEFAIKYILDALIFKAEASHQQRIHVKEDPCRRFVERAYKDRPIKIVEFEHLKHQCVVYLDLKHEECAKLSPSGRILSQDFNFGEQDFNLYAKYTINEKYPSGNFGLFLWMDENSSSTLDVEFEFSARSKPTEKYVSMGKSNHTFTKEDYDWGFYDLLCMPWSSFMAEDCVYFINGVLHLKVELTIKR